MSYEIENFGNDPCEECEEQIGKKAAPNADVKLHPNCKCEVVQNAAEETAEATEQTEVKEIVDDGANGEIEVQIAPVGRFKGSRADGSPIDEDLTKESLDKLADDLNKGDEVLVDVDHKSTKAGADKDSSAAGWLSGFFTNVKGLFAKMKLTKKGRELVDSREYRKLSPVFSLDQNGVPVKLHSVAMTNTPALDIEPILNSEPTQEIEMTKEEIVELIKTTIADMKAAEEAEKIAAEAENACAAKNEEAVVEEKKEEVKEEVAVEETQNAECETKDEKEMISEEALNSAPVPSADISSKRAWENLHGDEFFKYISAHKDEL